MVSLEREHIELMATLRKLPEMHDRLIVATALLKDAVLITTDDEIESSNLVETIW